MALYDRVATKSFYSEIANDQDACYYCEQALMKDRREGKISFDDFSKKVKALVGAMSGKRIMKFTYMGHSFCICNDCLDKIKNDIDINTVKKNEVKIETKKAIAEETAIVEPESSAKKSKKTGTKKES